MSEVKHQYHFAKIDWRDTQTPVSLQFDDVYFSRESGLEETRHIFLNHNRLHERWKQLDSNNPHTIKAETRKSAHFIIAETGFGTGLNFLATWQLWQQLAPADWTLHYISLEKYPLRSEDLRTALNAWPELEIFSTELINNYPAPVPGQHTLILNDNRIHLHLLIGDANTCLDTLIEPVGSESGLTSPCKHPWTVDAWFLDGFAPSKNPDMWNEKLFRQMHLLSNEHTTFATFTAAGNVRRGLQAAGFKVEKVAGFGKKREMMRGKFVPTQTVAQASQVKPANTRQEALSETPWFFPPGRVASKKQQAIIIGAGIAGSTSALSLAQRGWQTIVIESHQQAGQEGSGNPQGVLYTRLSPQNSELSEFALLSFQYALRFYQQHLTLDNASNKLCGVLQLAYNDKERLAQTRLHEIYQHYPDLVRFVDAQQASDIAGIELQHPALYYPKAGWLEPQRICTALLGHNNIQVLYGQRATELQWDGKLWHVLDQNGTLIQSAAVIVIANASDATLLTPTRQLPLKAIRGQVSMPLATAASRQLRCVICHDGYIAPPVSSGLSADRYQRHCMGATFTLNDQERKVKLADHQQNWSSLENHIPSLACALGKPDFTTLPGRTAFRCTTPDYLPIVGAVADQQAFEADYALLRKNARALINKRGTYLPGLYINVGHGSRGLTSAPLCANLLAALINGEPRPVSPKILKALSPARFIIRGLKRKQHF
jgi:tRNA 5-methylaminomethyl-2-thiouridine biosynthesis bifunctional protein